MANAKRLEELSGKRDQLVADLAAVDAELTELLGPATPANGSTRAKQTCKFELPDGTVCGSTEHNARFHKEK